jgi:hypothetical protein
MTPEEKKRKIANDWYHRNKEKISEKNRNNEKIKELKREKYNNLTEEEKKIISEKKKTYRELNKSKIKEQRKQYRENNKEIIKERKRIYNKNKRLVDPLFKLTGNIRVLIKNSIKYKNHKKNTKTENILGCSFEQFKKYLESKFESWMTWDNYGLYNGKPNYGWDIDHIIPTSIALTEEEIINLNHHKNLQPLCSYINRDIKKDAI